MAKVATGMPAGICTMESNESTPRKTALSTGTPSTGTLVWAAIIPGKCAAPAGPGDDGGEPVFQRGASEFCEQFRRAMGRNDLPVNVDAETFELRYGVPQGFPIGMRAHDDGDFSCVSHDFSI